MATTPPHLEDCTGIVAIEDGIGGMIPDGGEDDICETVGAGGGLGDWERESGGGAEGWQRGREGEGGGEGGGQGAEAPPPLLPFSYLQAHRGQWGAPGTVCNDDVTLTMIGFAAAYDDDKDGGVTATLRRSEERRRVAVL